MSTTSNIGFKVNFAEVVAPGVNYEQQLNAAANTSSPAINETIALSSGANTITKPTGAVGVMLIPPAGNLITMTLKGVTGDTGVALHLTDPTFIALATSVTTFVITTSNTLTLRFIWS